MPAVPVSASLNFTFYRGDSYSVAFRIFDSNGNLLPLTGATGSLVITSGATTVATIAGTPQPGQDGITPVMVYEFVPTDTSGLATNTYKYRARVTLLSGKVYTVAVATVSLI